MLTPRRLAACLAGLSLLTGGVLGGLGGVTAAQAAPVAAASARATAPAPGRYHQWATAATARIHPGTQMLTGDEQCTANFVFTDPIGNVYLGYAAHCSGTGGQDDTDGCLTGTVAIGTKVVLANGVSPLSNGTTVGTGRLVYSSWITMHRRHTKDADTCAYNDFALVRLDKQYRARTNPSVPVWGGPVKLAGTRPAKGATVLSWGQSSLRPTTALSAKRGTSLGTQNAWSTSAYTVTPGIPGDSGSGFLDSAGRAFGVLSTIALAPLAGSNGVGNLARELSFAKATSGIKGLSLTAGTQPFTG